MSTTTYIIIMAVCLLLSAYFSATETAFSSANVTRLKMLAEKGNSRAALACRLLERYDKLLSTILIGNNIVNIAMASLATALFVKSFGDAGATLSTIVVTVVVLIFGEISPKSIAKDCAEKCAALSAPILQVRRPAFGLSRRFPFRVRPSRLPVPVRLKPSLLRLLPQRPEQQPGPLLRLSLLLLPWLLRPLRHRRSANGRFRRPVPALRRCNRCRVAGGLRLRRASPWHRRGS